MIKIKLTKEQKKHLETIRWLVDFNENIAEGRSFLLAIAFIEMAIKYKNRWIQVFDHFPAKQATDRLLFTIKNIISQDKKLLERTEFRQREFKIGENEKKGH